MNTIQQNIPNFIEKQIKGLTKVTDIDEAINNQINNFTKEQEYGLINRLDNETAGLLYFAKNLSTLDNYSQLQRQQKIEKHYIAQIYGKPAQLSIAFPIMHRSTERMIAIQSTRDIKKGRGKEHKVQTLIKPLTYDPQSDISTLLVSIHKGIRHQIRVHLASIDSPVIGDPLYRSRHSKNLKLNESFSDVETVPKTLDTPNLNKVQNLEISKAGRHGEKKNNENLHLWSIGFDIKK